MTALGMTPSRTVPLMGGEPTWASAVGLFLLNFGHLEFLVFDLLARLLQPAEFERVRTLHLADRIEQLKTLLTATEAEQRAFADFEEALKPVRELRNHIAHGYFSMTMRPGTEEPLFGIARAKDLKICFSESTCIVSYDDLREHLAALTDVIERFNRLTKESGGPNG